jgi:hypothetical protein
MYVMVVGNLAQARHKRGLVFFGVHVKDLSGWLASLFLLFFNNRLVDRSIECRNNVAA